MWWCETYQPHHGWLSKQGAKSEGFVGVLTAEDRHYFDDAVIADAVVNAIDATHAAPVSLANIVNSGIGVWPLGYFLEAVEEGVVVAICCRFAP